MRLGEICGLRVEDVDLKRKTALIRDRKDPRNKLGNNQIVPLLPAAVEIVKPLVCDRETGFVFGVKADSASTAFTRAWAMVILPPATSIASTTPVAEAVVAAVEADLFPGLDSAIDGGGAGEWAVAWGFDSEIRVQAARTTSTSRNKMFFTTASLGRGSGLRKFVPPDQQEGRRDDQH